MHLPHPRPQHSDRIRDHETGGLERILGAKVVTLPCLTRQVDHRGHGNTRCLDVLAAQRVLSFPAQSTERVPPP